MLRIVWVAVKIGSATGAIGGLLTGLFAAVIGVLLTESRFALADFAVTTFLALVILLPIFFYINATANPDMDADRPLIQANAYLIGLIAWLPAIVLALIFFMMPVTMAPIVFNRGVTFENVGQWYSDVFGALLGARLVLVAVITLIGFMAITFYDKSRNP